jgi:uracil DNA glycosylase
MEKMDYEDFADKFGKWAPLFKKFIESKDMFDIYARLKADAQTDIIVPGHENVFKVFQLTDPDDIKCVFYLMDPYPKRYKNGILHATGIPMDCSNSADGKLQPSLQKFYEGIERCTKTKFDYSTSLKYLLDQGCLLMNTDLTCKLNKTSSHKGLWIKFQQYFLEQIMYDKIGITYVLCGDVSHKMERFINPIGNFIYKLEHPVSASYKNLDWNHKNIFTIINRVAKDYGKKGIDWKPKILENATVEIK